MKKLIILGRGGYGHTVADIASQLSYECIFLDDSIPDYPLSSFTEYIPYASLTGEGNKGVDDEVEFIPAFGDNALRMQWLEKVNEAGGQLTTLIHPTAYVSPTATIHEGTVILPKALINTDVVIERGCIINLGCIVDHGCVIEEGVHICLGAIVKGENRVGRLSKIEAGVVVQARTWPINQPE